MKEVFKAIAWGIATLTSGIFVLFIAAAQFITLNENCWLSTSKIDEIYSRVLPIVETLRTQYPGEEDKTSILGVDYHREADAANREIDRVTRLICPGVSYYRSASLTELYSPKGKLDLITMFQTEPSRIVDYNMYSVIRFGCLLLMLLVGSYTMYRLIKHRQFGFQSNTYFLLIAAPVVLSFTSFGLVYTDLSLSAHNADNAVYGIAVSIAWVFIVYPALYVLAKKRGGLKKTIFPSPNSETNI